MTIRQPHSLKVCLVFGLITCAGPLPCVAQSDFIRPGLLHTKEDLARMRAAVEHGSQPIAEAFQQFADQEFSQPDYRLRGPFPYVGRKPDRHSGEAASDATAAYQNALMWAITGRQTHADKSIQIINAWKGRLKKVGGIDGVLASGIQGFKFLNAAEILRYTDSGWSKEDASDAERWFTEVWHPTLKDYAHFANGNWETAALQTKMAIAVYCNDRQLFEQTVRYAVNGAGNGSIPHTIVYPSGQCQESTRKQHYAQLGLGLLGCAAEVAWNQGVDLYGWNDNRLLKGFEYSAAYGLGKEVPYRHYLDRTGKYGFGGRHQQYVEISPVSRGSFRPIFEQPYNHYSMRRGIKTPNLSVVIQRQRPEGRGRDHSSNGTLTHSRTGPSTADVIRPPGIPAGLVARSTDVGIQLSWVRSVEPVSSTNASGYLVKRATERNGPWHTVGSQITKTQYHDSGADRGRLYFYTVIAINGAGQSDPSWPRAANAGLPDGWSSSDVGPVGVPGYAEFNGHRFTLEGEGADIGGQSDEFHLAWKKMQGNGTITARIVQPMSSQWSKPGVMMRAGLKADAAHVSVLLLPPEWSGALVSRSQEGGESSAMGVTKIKQPFVINGNRLMDPYWVRLTRNNNTFTGFMSHDGDEWQKLATVDVEMPPDLFGWPACVFTAKPCNHTSDVR